MNDTPPNTHLFSLDQHYWREGPTVPGSHEAYATVPYGETFLLFLRGDEELIYKWDIELADWAVVAENYIQSARDDPAVVAIPSDFELECF